MGLHRQGSGAMAPYLNGDHKISGSLRSATTYRINDHESIDQEDIGPFRQLGSGQSETLGGVARNPFKAGRVKKLGRISKNRQCSVGFLVVVLLCVVAFTILGSDYLFAVGRAFTGEQGTSTSMEFFDDQKQTDLHSIYQQTERSRLEQKDQTDPGIWSRAKGKRPVNKDLDVKYGSNDIKKDKVHFGQAVDSYEGHGDSRYWDSDDRKREMTDIVDVKIGAPAMRLHSKVDFLETPNYRKGHINSVKPVDDVFKNLGLYNERGRKELRVYEQQFEAGLNVSLNNNTEMHTLVDRADDESLGEDDGYEDIDEDDEDEIFLNVTDDRKRLMKDGYTQLKLQGADDKQNKQEKHRLEVGDIRVFNHLNIKGETNGSQSLSTNTSSQFRRLADQGTRKAPNGQALKNSSMLERRISHSRKRRKHSGNACEIDFLNSPIRLKEPNCSARFMNFTINYVEREERPPGDSEWEPHFSGHQSFLERERSYSESNKILHCGFIQGPKGTPSTGFDLSENDIKYLATCDVAVSSCIFGNSDYIRSPNHKKISTSSTKKVCFVMFVDQKSLDAMISEGQVPDENGHVGLWKVVLVNNLPYNDDRRTGKVPKFLTHRLFPSARYSIWVDSKLRLQSDPLLILERFLWRGGYEYAISNHYDRHCVSEEVQQNKRLNKYNHSVIDEQYALYQEDGLSKFNTSDPNLLLPSYVPEGSFIIRAHTPMSNLFSCLWFNEVDRFTPRDQLSFAYTYLKLVKTNSGSDFFLHMFKDCERKAMAKLFRHKQEKAVIVLKLAPNFVS